MLERGDTNVLVTVGSKIGAKLLGTLMVPILNSVLPHSIVVMMVKPVLALIFPVQTIHQVVIRV
jgi:hypothetical protein